MKTEIKPAAQTTTYQDEEKSFKALRELREELIRNKIENDQLRHEIRCLKMMLQNRHLLEG